jgi:hypothetical protein
VSLLPPLFSISQNLAKEQALSVLPPVAALHNTNILRIRSPNRLTDVPEQLLILYTST